MILELKEKKGEERREGEKGEKRRGGGGKRGKEFWFFKLVSYRKLLRTSTLFSPWRLYMQC
jgi:hypothetical protein